MLFGSLQKITAQQLGFNPVLIVTANSTGGVMGKMIDAQSIVVATAATGQHGQEGQILRFVFWHSIALVGDHGRDRDAAGIRLHVDGAGVAVGTWALGLALGFGPWALAADSDAIYFSDAA